MGVTAKLEFGGTEASLKPGMSQKWLLFATHFEVVLLSNSSQTLLLKNLRLPYLVSIFVFPMGKRRHLENA